jgi:virginiamycin B lyase
VQPLGIMLRVRISGLLLAAFAAGCASHQELAPPVTTTAAYVSASPAPAQLRELWVPTAGAFPHDAAAAPDGAFWFTEMRANKIGRLDPSTGKVREYRLRTPDSDPHGLAVAEDGSVWFTASAKGYIGRLDPESGDVREYALPDRRAKDPHTLVFAPDGTLWFTVELSDFVGRLEPTSGEFQLRRLPRPGAKPYGIAIGKDGAAYVCEFGTNRIARVDPETLNVREYRLEPGTRPRRIAVAPDGTLFYTDFERGQLGQLDFATGVLHQWTAPSGPTSQPYAIAVTPDGDVWFSESGPRPSTLVRFDPKTEVFYSMQIPGGGIIRNMAVAPDGSLYMPSSDTDRLIIAKPAPPAVAMR